MNRAFGRETFNLCVDLLCNGKSGVCCKISASALAAEDAAVELEEPPQAVRASAAEVTPAAARKLRREIRRSNLIISFPLSNTALIY